MKRGHQVWFEEARRAAIFVAAPAVLAWYFGYPIVGLTFGLFVVISFWAYQLSLVKRWLDDPDGTPPEGRGLWGLLLDNIYLLQRRNEAIQDKLASALDYLQDSLASMRDAAVIVDNYDNIAWANESSDFLLGIVFPTDRGRPLLSLIRQPDFHDYFLAGDYSEPLRLLPTTDGDRCLLYEVSTFGEGDRLLFVRDVTENYKLEQMRKDFVGNVSHELRTPLTVIKGYIETLQGLDELAQPRIQRPLLQMQEQASRMENLLRDLLWLSRIEAVESTQKTESVCLSDLVTDTVKELRAAYSERVIKLDVESDVVRPGDQQELHSAISNLVINALKYSHEGPVTVTLRRSDDNAVLSVSDCGVGIAPKHLPRLTERFYRVDKSRSQRIGGTGLGLAIVKHVASSHQAELTVVSELGVGSTFSLKFPLVRSL